MKQAKNTTAKNTTLSLNKSIISKLNANNDCKGNKGQGNNYSSINTLPTGVLATATV